MKREIFTIKGEPIEGNTFNWKAFLDRVKERREEISSNRVFRTYQTRRKNQLKTNQYICV